MPRASSPSSDVVGTIDRWLGVAALGAVGLLGLAACLRKVWTADFWWQLAAGRHIAEHGWPSVDVFSYTMAGQPWIEMRGLFCLAEYHLTQAFGPAGPELAKCAVVLSAFALVTLTVLRRGTLVACAATLTLAVLAASQRFYERPEIVTWLFVGAFVLVLDRWRRTRTRWLYVLPLLQVVWVNSHPMFVFGPLLIGLMLAVELLGSKTRAAGSWKTLGAVVAATVVACLANPYGPHGLLVPFHQFAQMRTGVFKEVLTEYWSPFYYGTAHTAVLYYEALIGLCVVSALISYRRLDLFWLLLAASQLYLSLVAVRNLPLFALAAVPFVVTCLERSPLWDLDRVRPWLPLARRFTAGAVVVVCLTYAVELYTNRFSVRQNDSNQFGLGMAEHRYAIKAASFLDRAGLDGRVFSTLLESSYLVSRNRPVFADPRGDVYSEAVFAQFMAAQNRPDAWQAVVREYDVRIALVNLQSDLTRILHESPDWSLVYFDEVASVWLRADALSGLQAIEAPEQYAAVLRGLRSELPPPRPYVEVGFFERVTIPHPYLALARFLFTCGQREAARPLLDEAETASPYLPGIARLRLALAEIEGDEDAFIEYARAALREAPDDPGLLLELGQAYFRRRDLASAETWLEKSTEREPDRAVTWAMLGEIAILRQDFPQAVRHLEQAVARSPQTAIYRANLARALAMTGRRAEAIEGLRAAMKLEPDNVAILHDLAQLVDEEGQRETALAYLERALALDPNNPRLLELAARLRE